MNDKEGKFTNKSLRRQ